MKPYANPVLETLYFTVQETIADDLKRAGVMNLGLSLSKQIDELRQILGAVE